MKYSDNYFYKKLELDIILDELKSYLVLPNNILDLDYIVPFNNIEDVEKELSLVDEARIIYSKYNKLPLYVTSDLYILCDKASKDYVLSSIDLFEFVKIHSSINAISRLHDSIIKNKLSCNNILDIFNNLFINENLDTLLRNSIDDNGYILDTASIELKRLRKKVLSLDEKIKSLVNEVLNKSQSIITDNVIVIRDGRYCISIRSDKKNSFSGILRDSSQSKLTCYMEPLCVASLANEKDELLNEIKEEENRILKDLSNIIKNNNQYFIDNYNILSKLDLIFAKAMLAYNMNAYKPFINDTGELSLVNAIHPLLKVKKVIPNSLEFGKDIKGIVITGPNTGGKTVFLKTVGLLSLMIKFGLLIPCDENSNIMLYDNILSDIGDDQSIQSNLSTFSSHMNKIINIIDKSTPNSLVLIDELGSGTDPKEGSSLGISILDYFIKHNINFIITTHYSELKAYAYDKEFITNASMAFDNETNNPTYKLVIGKSGSSNALYTAKRLGLNKEIIDYAFKVFNDESNELSKLIYNLEKEKDSILKEKSLLEKSINKYNELTIDLNKRLKELDKSKDKILHDALIEADKIIVDSKNKVNSLIEEITLLKDTPIKDHEIIKIKTKYKELSNSIDLDNKKEVLDNHDFIVGDQVYLPSYDQYGVISKKLKKDSFEVSIGNLYINVSIKDMKFYKKEESSSNISVNFISDEDKKVSLRLDLRGMRYNEAYDALDKYINDLLLSHLKQASIIHGFGTGAIREMVQDYCKKSKFISSYRYGGESEGGYGVTVITLK